MLVVMQSHATPVQIDRVLEPILENPDPDRALSDGAQSPDFPGFERLLAKIRNLAEHL